MLVAAAVGGIMMCHGIGWTEIHAVFRHNGDEE
jgi:hypothetical protein